MAPAAGAIVVLVATRDAAPLADALTAFVVLTVVTRGMRSHRAQAALCPAIAPCYAVIEGLGAGGAILALQVATGRPQLSPPALAILASSVMLMGRPADTILRMVRGRLVEPVRVACIGSERNATYVARGVERTARGRITVVGRIAPPDENETSTTSCLGPVDQLKELVVSHRIDQLVLESNAWRLGVCEQLAAACLDHPVRLIDYSDFCEETLGHVPMSEIDATWFAYFLRPAYAPESRVAKRAMDIGLGAVMAAAAAPVIGVLALLVRRDGGPAFFTQERIGYHGRPFKLIKLRTMRVGVSSEWAHGETDPRVTPLGRVLRRTHLDELPELVNVLRGEMSLVGPRPEQTTHVARLERALPFYDRRHLIKPGLTGWAALRCGYGGSDAGSAWKLCHDMCYVKQRSVGFDLLILAETAAELVTGRTIAPDGMESLLDGPLRAPVDAVPGPAEALPIDAAPGVVARFDYER
jgi:lipopolysaccharide/colanic/teichoic acid biosynthesis glycosyltransferase